MHEEARIDLDAIPKILQAKGLVRGVLIVVGVRDRQTDHGCVVWFLEQIHRNTVSYCRQTDRIVSGRRHDRGHLYREGKIQRGSSRRIATTPLDLYDLTVPEAG